MLPMIVVGASVGVMLNIILPAVVVAIILTLLLLLVSWTTFTKLRAIQRKEKETLGPFSICDMCCKRKKERSGIELKSQESATNLHSKTINPAPAEEEPPAA